MLYALYYLVPLPFLCVVALCLSYVSLSLF